MQWGCEQHAVIVAGNTASAVSHYETGQRKRGAELAPIAMQCLPVAIPSQWFAGQDELESNTAM
jgi:hypothetical protein